MERQPVGLIVRTSASLVAFSSILASSMDCWPLPIREKSICLILEHTWLFSLNFTLNPRSSVQTVTTLEMIFP